ncbi:MULTISPECIES: P-loop ATPase, Sll1717 family [Niastella]|uniref:Uncharacterized protein n=1 Tax=Niastella soli TaxID=2821487 RepID=A0ABS3YVS9_9BACT|nr:hypothetical protein [Niastella soli]MBO9202037.1 hypothetical protein [Niastella soli]
MIETDNFSKLRTDLIKEIATNWKLEAKSEDVGRYFYHMNEVEAIISGAKNYVIGRKGTGKTAISEFILGLGKTQKGIFCEKLSFKNFPFNDLYELSNLKYTPPNQYITLWKYLIYSVICRLMLKNNNINSQVRKSLSLSYNTDPITNLPVVVSNWTDANFKLQNDTKQPSNLSWIEKVNILEGIIQKNLDNEKYYIIFDELDEDYRDIKNIEEFKPYNNLITSLFKAVQDVKNIFRLSSLNINPVIFLRDDIYDLIKDTDKNKWSDYKIEIDWDENKIKRLLAFRISKAISTSQHVLNFDKAWELIFHRSAVRMGDKQSKEMHTFDFIARSTQMRPRDFIKYIQACAEDTYYNHGRFIYPQTIKQVDKAFSNYLKAEVEDEIQAILPDIPQIFQVLSQIRKWNFTVQEFKTAFANYVQAGTIKETNMDFVIQALFNFNVIGNLPRQRQNQFFRYKNKEARINFNESIVVHRGLFKSLQIL